MMLACELKSACEVMEKHMAMVMMMLMLMVNVMMKDTVMVIVMVKVAVMVMEKMSAEKALRFFNLGCPYVRQNPQSELALRPL